MDAEANRRFAQQIHDLWISPEIERRREAGVLPADFKLAAVQVIMNVDRPHHVRLNDEVRAVMWVDPVEKARLDMQIGQPIYWDQIGKVRKLQLTDVDPNAGHITMVAVSNGTWLIVFDFHYNAARVNAVVSAADEFLASAVDASERGHARSFAENLFAATELAAKARLLLMPDKHLLDAKTHRYIAQQINLHGRWGNIDKRFVKLHNSLVEMRGTARYVQGDVSFTGEEMAEMIEVVRALVDCVKADTPARYEAGCL